MSEWKQRRFWKEASTAPAEDGAGWQVLLDGRPVRTPAKARLLLPTEALGQEVAAEWAAQGDTVDPGAMPYTRMANSAIDKVAVQFDAVTEMVAAYGGTDLLCYRADGPDTLVQRQAEDWDPLLDWAASGLNAPLVMTSGIMHVEQPANSVATLQSHVRALSPFEVAALHDLVALSGSLVIGLGVLHGVLPVAELWRRSRVDETFQQEQWGVDEEAAEVAALKRAEFLHAARFLALCNPGSSGPQ